jgi:GntR family transcriptional regulator
MIAITINPADEVPIYRQIMRQITEAVVTGKLRRGDKLASHRELSEQIVVAPLTVKKAYDELEALGYIETRRGRGTFICAQLPRLDREEQIKQVRLDARRLVISARLAGLGQADTVRIVRETDREMPAGAGPEKESL